MSENNDYSKKIHEGYYQDRKLDWINWGKPFYPDIKERNINSICDVGCGDGSFVNDMCSTGIKEVHGVDLVTVAMNLVKENKDIVYHNAPATALPLGDKSIELLTAFDVLEHIHPSEVDNSLKEFSRVATDYFMFSISHRLSGEEHGGKNLHLTVKPFSWWEEKISQYASLEKTFKGPHGNTNCIWKL